MQLSSLSVAYACPYHNPNATLGNSCLNIDLSTLLALARLYTWSAVVSPVERSATFSKIMLEATYGREIKFNYLVSARVDIPAVSMPIARSLKT